MGFEVFKQKKDDHGYTPPNPTGKGFRVFSRPILPGPVSQDDINYMQREIPRMHNEFQRQKAAEDQELKSSGLPSSRELKEMNLNPDFVKKAPWLFRPLINVQQTVTKWEETSPVGRFEKRASERAADIAAPGGKVTTSTGNKFADLLADITGTGAGFLVPGGVGGATLKAGEAAVGTKTVSSVLSKLPKGAPVASRAIEGAVGGAAWGAAESVSKGMTGKEALKNIISEAAMGAGGDVVVRGALEDLLPKASKYVADRIASMKEAITIEKMQRTLAEDLGVNWDNLNKTQQLRLRKLVEQNMPKPKVGTDFIAGTRAVKTPIRIEYPPGAPKGYGKVTGGKIINEPYVKDVREPLEMAKEIAPEATEVMVEDAKMRFKTQAPNTDIDYTTLQDISGFKGFSTDVYRIFRDVFGKHFDKVKNRILDPLDDAKKANADMQKDWLVRLKEEVVDKLNIRKGSEKSALVLAYGEGNITLGDVQARRPDDWEDIVEADKWFRKAYDELLDRINKTRQKIYPNQPDKIVPRRKDYYRHFREMADTIEGIKNLFDTPAAIDPSLEGVSAFTKPKARFAGFMQRRTKGPYTEDAVGGFLDYIPAASYAINIDPQIGVFRNLHKEISAATEKTKNLNGFLKFLHNYANDLAGKTNPADRFFQDAFPDIGIGRVRIDGRTAFRILNKLNSRIKGNVILGNIGSSLSQLANVPQGIAFAKQHSIPGMVRTVRSILRKNGAIKSSGFIKERFLDRVYRQFDDRLIEQPK